MKRFVVDGHCVLDTKRVDGQGIQYCVADCLDLEFSWGDGLYADLVARGNYAERLARRVARLLNVDAVQRSTRRRVLAAVRRGE